MARGTPVASGDLVASLVLSTRDGGVLYTCAGELDASAPDGTYFVQLIDSDTPVTGGGAVTHLAPAQRIDHKSGITEDWSFDEYIPHDGIALAHGATVQLSTTRATGTLAAAYMVAGGSR